MQLRGLATCSEGIVAVCMLGKMYSKALYLALLLLSEVTFATPHLVTRQDRGLTYRLYDIFQEWQQQNTLGGKSDPRPETALPDCQGKHKARRISSQIPHQ